MADIMRTISGQNLDQDENVGSCPFVFQCQTSSYKKMFRPTELFSGIWSTFMRGCHSEHDRRQRSPATGGSTKTDRVNSCREKQSRPLDK